MLPYTSSRTRNLFEHWSKLSLAMQNVQFPGSIVLLKIWGTEVRIIPADGRVGWKIARATSEQIAEEAIMLTRLAETLQRAYSALKTSEAADLETLLQSARRETYGAGADAILSAITLTDPGFADRTHKAGLAALAKVAKGQTAIEEAKKAMANRQEEVQIGQSRLNAASLLGFTVAAKK